MPKVDQKGDINRSIYFVNGKKRDFITVLAFLLFAAFCMPICVAEPTTWTVGPSGCDFTSIQAAINAANWGDTVEVHSGTYYENVRVVNKKLTLRGVDTGGGKPVVDAGGTGRAISLFEDGITVEGFYITNSSDRLAGIFVGAFSDINIKGNTVSNNWIGIC